MSDLIASKRDDAFQALQPAAVVGYLRSRGWEKSRDYGQNGAVFRTKIGAGDAEVIVPIERQARDFPSVMELLITDLSRIEERSGIDVLADLSIAG